MFGRLKSGRSRKRNPRAVDTGRGLGVTRDMAKNAYDTEAAITMIESISYRLSSLRMVAADTGDDAKLRDFERKVVSAMTTPDRSKDPLDRWRTLAARGQQSPDEAAKIAIEQWLRRRSKVELKSQEPDAKFGFVTDLDGSPVDDEECALMNAKQAVKQALWAHGAVGAPLNVEEALTQADRDFIQAKGAGGASGKFKDRAAWIYQRIGQNPR
jgi:hypothetical protein